MKLSNEADGQYVLKNNKDVRLDVNRFRMKFGLSLLALIIATLLVQYASAANTISINLFRIINQPVHPILSEYLLTLMEFGSFWTIFLIVAMAALLRRWVLALGIIAAQALSFVVANTIKIFVTFERPYLVLENVNTRITMDLYIVEGQLNASGYPSGHTTAATILIVLLWPYVTKPIRGLLVALLVTVMIGRVYSGVHFPLDIVGGFLLGTTIGLLVRQLLHLITRRSKAETTAEGVGTIKREQ